MLTIHYRCLSPSVNCQESGCVLDLCCPKNAEQGEVDDLDLLQKLTIRRSMTTTTIIIIMTSSTCLIENLWHWMQTPTSILATQLFQITAEQSHEHEYVTILTQWYMHHTIGHIQSTGDTYSEGQSWGITSSWNTIFYVNGIHRWLQWCEIGVKRILG